MCVDATEVFPYLVSSISWTEAQKAIKMDLSSVG
jgi:hypothetical protein